MFIATSTLLLTLLGAPAGLQAPAPEPTTTAESTPARQGSSGLVIAPDVEGRLAIMDSEGRLVMEIDKAPGRQVRISLEPGVYEARMRGDRAIHARFVITEGQDLVLSAVNFREAAAPAPPPGLRRDHEGRGPRPQAPLDGRHRIEARFGGWGDSWYGHDSYGNEWDSAQGAFGIEYLNFITPDFAVGVGLTAVGHGRGNWNEWDGDGRAQGLVGIPVMFRWYPARRATRSRSVEPYLTAGVGPYFAVDAIYEHDGPHAWGVDYVSTAHVGTTVGGRAGVGVDFRIGPVFTLGVAGAWSWNGFKDSSWNGPRPSRGEFTVTLGWNFGR